MGKIEKQKSKVSKPKILIIDDEAQIRDAIADLISDDYDAIIAKHGADGVELAKKESPDLVLLDIIMPGTDGMEVCAALRNDPATRHIPIIMLSAAGSKTNRIHSFGNGADDFIAKPFDAEELMVRIAAKLRRSREKVAKRVKFVTAANLQIDQSNFHATIDGVRIQLSSLELSLLKLLVKNFNQVVTRKDIIKKVWKKEDVPDRLIDAHMVSLRKKISAFRGELATIYGKGYILKGPEL